MSKRLDRARKLTKEMPDKFFGEGTGLLIDDLPCVQNKVEKIKKTYNFNKASIEKIEEIAKNRKVAVGDLISDIIDKVI